MAVQQISERFIPTGVQVRNPTELVKLQYMMLKEGNPRDIRSWHMRLVICNDFGRTLKVWDHVEPSLQASAEPHSIYVESSDLDHLPLGSHQLQLQRIINGSPQLWWNGYILLTTEPGSVSGANYFFDPEILAIDETTAPDGALINTVKVMRGPTGDITEELQALGDTVTASTVEALQAAQNSQQQASAAGQSAQNAATAALSAQQAAQQAAQLVGNVMVFIAEDDISVTLAFGSNIQVAESNDPYPSLTITIP